MKDEQPLYDVDRVIHEPARLLLATILYTADQADFLFLLNETGLTKGNLSAHLSKLEAAGYVEIEKTYRGKVPQTLCRLTEAGRKAFETYRKQMNQILKRI
ncbi:MAG: ArsR family transcriptional regulator [Chloroflexi bacterium HGW-Chloroflexi-10]|nr:MAG: ArsR family transcriptional regulator [Chloroflexi bacterium HGW-Chloroflexi-10]